MALSNRPLGYYDELRNSSSAKNSESRQDSTVIQVLDDDENDTVRLCQLTSLLPLSSLDSVQGIRQPIDFRIGLEASGFLAMVHFNQRDSKVLPQLTSLLENCNVYWTVDYMDTQFSPIHASGKYHKAETQSSVKPTALVGAARSVVSSSVAVLGSVYQTPQISATSTSATLDNKDAFTYFARTVPNNRGDAHAVLLYLRSLNVENFGVIYVRDDYGTYFHKDVLELAREMGITVVSAPYEDDVEGSLDKAIDVLERSKLKYFFGIPNPRTYREMLIQAYQRGIVGNTGYVWLLSESTLELLNPSFRLNAVTDMDLVRAIHGVGVVVIDVPSHPEFDAALQEFSTNDTLQEYFISRHTEPELFDNYDFEMPGSSLYQYLNYDAVMAMGLAACNAENDFFSGHELYESLLNTAFEGVSGTVEFNVDTGTRSSDSLIYAVHNVISNGKMQDGFIQFESQVAAVIDLAGSIEEVRPFVYAGSPDITPPLALPPLEEDMNLISPWVHVLGYGLATIVMIMSLGWLIWTVLYRKKPVVRASQPVFLVKLCVGTFIMASSIIPQGLQEPVSQRGLDIACMAAPWLLSIGFVTSFSALFSKTWRLNRVFAMSREFRRVKIRANDVLLPFVVLMGLNLSILIAWTIIAPLQWTRVQKTKSDEFGRSNESYGTCLALDSTKQRIFVSCLAVVNVIALMTATYQAYKARNIPPSNFNESTYITISLASLVEAFILAVPILVVVADIPSAYFLMHSILVTIICLAIQVPLFVPKYINRNARPLESTRRRAVRTSMYLSDRDGVAPMAFGARPAFPGRPTQTSGTKASNGRRHSSPVKASSYGVSCLPTVQSENGIGSTPTRPATVRFTSCLSTGS